MCRRSVDWCRRVSAGVGMVYADLGGGVGGVRRSVDWRRRVSAGVGMV